MTLTIELPEESLMALPAEERRRRIQTGAAAMEAAYRDDLARPVADRELTEITALDADPVTLEYEPAA